MEMNYHQVRLTLNFIYFFELGVCGYLNVYIWYSHRCNDIQKAYSFMEMNCLQVLVALHLITGARGACGYLN